MTDVFGMFPSANNSNYQTNRQNDKTTMLQLNNYSNVDFNNHHMYGDLLNDDRSYYNNNQYRMNQSTAEESPQSKRETIHSGHFMVSEIDEDADNEQNTEEDSIIIKEKEEELKNDQQIVQQSKLTDRSIVQFQNFKQLQNKKNWNIDYPKSSPPLEILFKRMNIGFDSNNLTSPKWKQFKGLKISLKAKIRVNNMIWRAWHIKYVMMKTPAINPFPPNPDTDQLETNHLYIAHRPEVVMKIGKFFKASQEFIALEYNKWRRYYKEIIQNEKNQLRNQWNNIDTFNSYENSNDQFNMIFNTMNTYSSSQLGYGAELMQPDFSYDIQPEFMDTFEEPCLQSFLTQKNSFLPTLIEEDLITEQQPKIQGMSSQTIYQQSSNSSSMNANYDQQLVNNQMSNQMNNQLNNNLQQTSSQLPSSPINYDYLNYQQQTLIQNQQQQQTQLNQPQYRQSYLTNNLIVDQQSTSTSLTNNLNSNLQNNISTNLVNQQASLSPGMISIEQHQQITNNLNNNQLSNGQFVAPKPVKQKIRSRSVSSLPPNQQMQLQRQHMIENSSSLMEINQPVCTNQSQFHNTTSNLVSSQQNNNLSNQNNLEPQMINERTSYIQQRRNAATLNPMINNLNNQVSIQQQQQNLNNNNQLQTISNNNYYNLNDVNNMNTLNNQQQSINNQTIDYNENRNIRNQTNSTSFYQQQLTNSNYNKYQPTDSGSNLISQLLQSTNSNKLATVNNVNIANNNNNNLTSQNSNTNSTVNNNNSLPYKRNSTGTYPNNFQYGSLQEQFNNSSISSSSSVTNLAMNTTNVNTNVNSLNNELNRKNLILNNQLHNRSYNSQNYLTNSSVSPSMNINQQLATQQQQQNQANLINNDYQSQQTPITTTTNKSNLNSSLENLSKSVSTKTRIKREHNRKLSTGRLRNSNSSLMTNSNLSRSNSSKSINHNSPVSPTTSLQSTILNNQNKSSNNNELILNNFERTPHLILQTNNSNNLNTNLNLNTNTNTNSSLSSTPTLQSPIGNSPFASSIQNEYSNDSLQMFNNNQTTFGLNNINQNLNNLTNSQLKSAIKSSQQLSNSSTANSPSSSLNNNLIKNERDPNLYKEHRRVCHINAEQKRRCNIKHGFDTLRAILPSISSNNNTKISKAAMLMKGAEHIRQMRIEQEAQNKEIEGLRAQIENLNQTIGIFQNQLPATGAPISGGMRPGQIKERFENYVREKTNQNWKFWMFSIIMEPLLDSYNNTIPTTNFDELTSSVLRWLDQSCNLINLRRDVLNSLRIISTSTNVLLNPASLSEESLAAVRKKQIKKK